MREGTSFLVGVLSTTAAAAIIALFFAGDVTQVWDILKLAIQGLGALLISWLAVRWAIHTFKTQKSWERDATTYVDIVSALREMKRVLAIWMDEETKVTDHTEIYLKTVSHRWNAAKTKFEESAARAIFLPDTIYSVVLQFEDRLANSTYSSSFEEIDSQSFLVSEALRKLESMRDVVR